jgi:DNA-binding NtrC family response regulator
VVAATHRDLREEVNEGRFRADLFFRLAVIEIVLPPLRSHPEDLPLVVESLLESLDARDRPEAAGLTTRAFLDGLARHAWPGNVRELRNYLERCLVLAEPAPLEEHRARALLELPIDPRRPLKEARQDFVRAFERRYLEELLASCKGNVTAAAKQAGVDRIHFYRLLWRYGLR